MVVAGINGHGNAELAEVVQAGRADGSFSAGGGQGGQEHYGQQRDCANHH